MDKYVTIESIIAKIDNDFNPDNTDWIPRVAAWAIDAMNQLKVLRVQFKERNIKVINKIAKSPCSFDNSYIKVYDSNGCEIKELKDKRCIGCQSTHPSTGGEDSQDSQDSQDNNINSIGGIDTRQVINTGYDGKEFYRTVTTHNNTTDEVNKHNVYEEYKLTPRRGMDRNYIIVDSNTIELSFDTSYITVLTKEVVTKYSDYYKTEIPVIPNNGILIEAIGFYCMYKMLCRGYKHPVFNLNASQYGTNPYYMWTTLRDKARISVTLDTQGDIDSNNQWQGYFYNYTFPKR